MSRNGLASSVPFLRIRILAALGDDEQAAGAVAGADREHRAPATSATFTSLIVEEVGAAAPAAVRERCRSRGTRGLARQQRRRRARRRAGRSGGSVPGGSWCVGSSRFTPGGRQGARARGRRRDIVPHRGRRVEPVRSLPAPYPRAMSADDSPRLGRPEHDRAAPRGAGEGARRGVRAGLRRPGRGLPATGRPRPGSAGARRAGGHADAPGLDRPRPRRRDRRSRPRLRVRSAPRRRRRRHPAPPGQAEPRRRARRARGVDAGPRHPDARPDRGARHARGRRHVLAPPGPAVHRPDAAHERRRRTTAGGDRRRGRAGVRRAVLEGPGRARPPALGRSRRWRTTWRSCSCR